MQVSRFEVLEFEIIEIFALMPMLTCIENIKFLQVQQYYEAFVMSDEWINEFGPPLVDCTFFL